MGGSVTKQKEMGYEKLRLVRRNKGGGKSSFGRWGQRERENCGPWTRVGATEGWSQKTKRRRK